MSNPTEAPRIFWVEMKSVGRCRWHVRFGCIDVMISDYRNGFYWAIGGATSAEPTIADCVTAIERELLAIRAAIPEAKP
jgi:hypothetical protein